MSKRYLLGLTNKLVAKSYLVLTAISGFSIAKPVFAEQAFSIAGKAYTVEEIRKENQSEFFDIEKKKYEMIEQFAKSRYLEYHWETEAKKAGKPVPIFQKQFFESNVKVSDKQIKETLDKFKDHPQLSKLKENEQRDKVKEYLTGEGQAQLVEGIIDTAIKDGKLKIAYPAPQEPIYDVKVVSTDHVRYGPAATDVKGLGCEGDACPITIVEYSEFQCPFCERVLPDVKKILADYKGKVRWIVRDFPLSFHDRARPAAIAAACAAAQGQDKYWGMYTELFANQRALSDADLAKYAGKIGVDKSKWEKCVANPGEVLKIIQANQDSGQKYGVSGTPAFFINGRKLSGALPYAEFKKVIDSELSKSRKS